MITKAPSYVTSDGKSFVDLKAAQIHSLRLLFGEKITQGQAEACEELVRNHLEQLIDIVTTTERSKPKARKINGGTKKRKPAQP